MPKGLTESSIKQAVEITVATIPSQTGNWIADPERVAKFVETVARKIEELRGGQQ